MNEPIHISRFLTGIMIDIEQVGKASALPDFANGRHPLAHHTLFYIAKGEGEMIINGLPLHVARDSLYLYVPGTTLELRMTSIPKLEICFISFDLFRVTEKTHLHKVFERDFTFPVQGHVRMSDNRFIRLFDLLAVEGAEARERNRFLGQQYVYEMLDALLPFTLQDTKKDTRERLKHTIQYMNRHYHEDIRVEKLAGLAQFHPAYYSQVFKQTMDKTPVSFLTQLRMNKAKELLLTTDKTIREVAQDVGYGDEFYFSRRFKETSGVAPTIYTKRTDFKIVSLSSPYTDHLYTLGLMPSAAQLHRFLPLVTKALALPKHASDPWEINRSIFLDVKPDLIICKNNVLAHARENINDIAPIISIPWTTKDVYTHLKDIAELLNKQDAAQQWLDNHARKAERLRKSVSRHIAGATVAVCAATEKGLRMYSARNIGHVFYRSLELTPPDLIRNQMENHAVGTNFNWTAITPDEIKHYEADFLFIAIGNESDKKRVQRFMRTNPAWMRHPAVRSKRVYFLDWEKWIVYAPYVIDQQLEEAEQLFSGASSQLEYI